MKHSPTDHRFVSSPRHYSQLGLPAGDLWIFGYGSLMWHPGIPFVRWAPATIFGYHRAMCIYSSRWRGTPERPGLVLGLDRGGCCRGIAFQVRASEVPMALETLWEREMRRAVYEPKLVRARVASGEKQALTFIADPGHSGYAGKLSIARIAKRVATCSGDRGPNFEYLRRTVEHLTVIGVRDRTLLRVLAVARAMGATGVAATS